MSALLQPWLNRTLLRYVQEHPDMDSSRAGSHCQIVRWLNSSNPEDEQQVIWGEISDTEFQISVQFSPTCRIAYERENRTRLTYDSSHSILVIKSFTPKFSAPFNANVNMAGANVPVPDQLVLYIEGFTLLGGENEPLITRDRPLRRIDLHVPFVLWRDEWKLGTRGDALKNKLVQYVPANPVREPSALSRHNSAVELERAASKGKGREPNSISRSSSKKEPASSRLKRYRQETWAEGVSNGDNHHIISDKDREILDDLLRGCGYLLAKVDSAPLSIKSTSAIPIESRVIKPTASAENGSASKPSSSRQTQERTAPSASPPKGVSPPPLPCAPLSFSTDTVPVLPTTSAHSPSLSTSPHPYGQTTFDTYDEENLSLPPSSECSRSESRSRSASLTAPAEDQRPNVPFPEARNADAKDGRDMDVDENEDEDESGEIDEGTPIPWSSSPVRRGAIQEQEEGEEEEEEGTPIRWTPSPTRQYAEEEEDEDVEVDSEAEIASLAVDESMESEEGDASLTEDMDLYDEGEYEEAEDDEDEEDEEAVDATLKVVPRGSTRVRSHPPPPSRPTWPRAKVAVEVRRLSSIAPSRTPAPLHSKGKNDGRIRIRIKSEGTSPSATIILPQISSTRSPSPNPRSLSPPQIPAPLFQSPLPPPPPPKRIPVVLVPNSDPSSQQSRQTQPSSPFRSVDDPNSSPRVNEERSPRVEMGTVEVVDEIKEEIDEEELHPQPIARKTSVPPRPKSIVHEVIHAPVKTKTKTTSPVLGESSRASSESSRRSMIRIRPPTTDRSSHIPTRRVDSVPPTLDLSSSSVSKRDVIPRASTSSRRSIGSSRRSESTAEVKPKSALPSWATPEPLPKLKPKPKPAMSPLRFLPVFPTKPTRSSPALSHADADAQLPILDFSSSKGKRPSLKRLRESTTSVANASILVGGREAKRAKPTSQQPPPSAMDALPIVDFTRLKTRRKSESKNRMSISSTRVSDNILAPSLITGTTSHRDKGKGKEVPLVSFDNPMRPPRRVPNPPLPPAQPTREQQISKPSHRMYNDLK